MSYISRNIERLFLEVNKEYPCVLLTGLRQSGKTTMLLKLMKDEGRNRSYVTLDDIGERELAKKDPALFFQLHKPPVCIDEVQYAPELFSYVKIIADEKQQVGDFWLTGSQIFRLMGGVQESLAGRVAVLSMQPLSYSEIIGQSNAPFKADVDALSERERLVKNAGMVEIYKRIFYGGMPGLVSGRYSNRKIFYSSYISTYLERDVKFISEGIDSLKFLRFLTTVAARTGQLLNYKGIADEAEIDQATAKKWLLILERLGIIFYLYPYSNNVLKRTIKTPKLYFADTGLVCYLTKWSSVETLMTGAMNGAALENYAIAEIRKSYINEGMEPYLHYYRDKDAREIDILIEQDGILSPFEIKRTALPEKRMLRHFDVLENAGLKRGVGAVLCMAEHLSAFDRDNLIVPVSLI